MKGLEISIERKRFVVELMEAFERERKAGKVVSTVDTTGRVASLFRRPLPRCGRTAVVDQMCDPVHY